MCGGAAAAASKAAASSAAATRTKNKAPRKMYVDCWPRSNLWYFCMLAIPGLFYLGTSLVFRVGHKEHQFLPIYNEKGDLEGFTHPVLIEAADKVREKKRVSA